MIGGRILRISNFVRKSKNALRACSTTAGVAEPTKWDILTAVCVERLPVATPNLNELERRFKTHLEDVQLKNSYKSDHELRHENDIKHAERVKNETISAEEMDVVNKTTAADLEDMWNEEFAKFNFASLETDADKQNDTESLERKLQSHLVLLVEQNVGEEKMFVLPQGDYKEGETLRQTAERVFEQVCGNDIKAQFFGNAPSGFMKYKWKNGDNVRNGVKLFFYYARHISGQVDNNKQYKWVTRDELRSLLPKKYHNSINNFLVDERS